MCLDYLGVRLNAERAGDLRLTVNLELTDTGERSVIELANGALNHSPGRAAGSPDATVRIDRHALDRLVGGHVDLAELAAAGDLQAEPSLDALEQIAACLDEFSIWFNVVEP
jgi:alkyl sulfatase BDS1-like metallo-beta-lactamase superfamily hydrolase